MTGEALGGATPRVKVWDGAVRVLHWTLVATVPAALLTTEWWVGWHQPLGWIATAAVALRLLWGVAASPRDGYARFTQFVRSPRATWAYFGQWRRGQEPRFLGHNPLGAWMVLALLGWVLGLALTGWLYTTDRFFGDATLELVHEWLAWSLPVLVALHVWGVVHASRRHRENLLRAMIDGEKRAPRGPDIA